MKEFLEIQINKDVVGKYYISLLEIVMKDNELIGIPANIINMDETGFQLNNKPGDVIAVSC